MKILELPAAVLRFQYQLARYPLGVIEQQMATRLDDEAPARLFYERSLGRLDATVGSVLRDDDLARRGVELVERTEALGRAARLDAAAEAKKQKADSEFETKRDQALEKREAAREATQEDVTQARQKAEERKQSASQAYEKRTASVKQRADETASRRVKAAESAKKQEEQQIEATAQKAAKAAAAKLDDAQSKRTTAAKQRSEADRIEELAEVQKDKRKAD